MTPNPKDRHKAVGSTNRETHNTGEVDSLSLDLMRQINEGLEDIAQGRVIDFETVKENLL